MTVGMPHIMRLKVTTIIYNLLLLSSCTEAQCFLPAAYALVQPGASDTSRLQEKALDLQSQGRYQDAIPLAEQVLAIREQVLPTDHLDIAQGLNLLGNLYRLQGQYMQAEPLYVRSLVIREKNLGSTDLLVAETQSNLADLYRLQGRYDQAFPLYQKSLATREQKLGNNHPDVAKTINGEAELYKLQGKYEQAEPLYQRSLGILEQQLGPRHPDVARTLNNLAALYKAQGQCAKAEPLYQRSLSILESVLGPAHPEVATSLNNLAFLLQSIGKYEQAESLYQRSLSASEKSLGADHPAVATSLNNMAALYQLQGQYTAAEPLYQRSLEIRERAFGVENPEVAASLNNLAELHKVQGHYAKAEPLYQKSIAIRERILGSNHPDVAKSLNNLATFYQIQGLYTKAEPLYRRSLTILEQSLSSDHPEVAKTLNNYAALYKNQGQYAKAEPLYQRSLAIRTKTLGANHPAVATSLLNLAFLYQAQGQFAKAEPLFQRSLEIQESTVGAKHHDFANSLESLASLYQMQGQYQKAEPLYQRSLAIYEAVFGPNHLQVATSLNNIAFFYQSQRQYDKAEPLYLRSLAIREKALDPSNPDLAQSLNNLAGLYQAEGKLTQAESLFKQSLGIYEKSLGKNDPNVARSLNNLTLLYHSNGKINQAVEAFSRGLEIEETNLSPNLILGTEQDKRDYLGTFLRTTNYSISLHLQSARQSVDAANLAFTTILRRKGRVLDILGQKNQIIRQQLNSSLHQEFDELVALRTELAQLVFEQSINNGQRQEKYLALDQRVQALEVNLSRKSIAFQHATQPISLNMVKSAIPAKAALIEFVQYQPYNPSPNSQEKWGKPRYAAYVMQNQGDVKWADLGSVDEMQPLISTFLKTIKDQRKDTNQVKVAARELDAILMQPVRELFRQQPEQLLIAPDSQLNLIPFAALVDQDNQYLLERYHISYLTSGRDLLAVNDNSVKSAPPLIVANPSFDLPQLNQQKTITAINRGRSGHSEELALLTFSPLPATAQEASEILPLLPHSRAFMGSEATETVIKQNPNPSILHLATHGFFLRNDGKATSMDESRPRLFNVENPLLRSGLVFAGFNHRRSGVDDGVLTALEVAGLDLRGTQLVVLSACETGLGDISNGEGVYGLRRAFTIAGAQSQLMTLWEVSDDGTRDLMIRYYQALKQGHGRADALRQVQLAMVHQQVTGKSTMPGVAPPNYEHPYYWSAFMPIGDWRPLPMF